MIQKKIYRQRMGCICAKQSNVHDYVPENEKGNHTNLQKVREGSSLQLSRTTLGSSVSFVPPANLKENGKTRVIERPKSGPQRHSTSSSGIGNETQQAMCRVTSVPRGAKAEQVAAGWPSWLASVAGEAIHGWTPRSPDSYEKLNKIGQGTYSSVYRARDLTTDKVVAMKLVRFSNMDPDSVRFMAREICILRRLDHRNVIKLEALVTSRISGSLYLVFEYMEHDLAGLLASPEVKFTEPQIKCFVRQMLLGLQHCHSRGILHRDIKGSNLLVGDDGILKIGDFGLATPFGPDRNQPLTSHVVTLWYRAPELLLGATQYGVEIDMWSAGSILAELFAGKPIMPGRTEVEQLHKIFKLCGSPTEEYWGKTKLPQVTSFKPQRPYKRRVAEAFKYFPSTALALVEVLLSIDPELRGTASSALKSAFFISHPLPCDPSSLPKYPPCKELDAKLREEEVQRQKAERVKGHGAEHKGRLIKSSVEKYIPLEDNETSCRVEQLRAVLENGCSHSDVVTRPSAVRYSSSEKEKDGSGPSIPVKTLSCSRQGVEPKRQGSQLHPFEIDASSYHSKGADSTSNNDSIGYVPKKNRIFRSGPLIPQGGNMEDLLKEHERQIQEAVRRSRLGKSRAKESSLG